MTPNGEPMTEADPLFRILAHPFTWGYVVGVFVGVILMWALR